MQIVGARDTNAQPTGSARATRDARCRFCSFCKRTFVLLEFGLSNFERGILAGCFDVSTQHESLQHEDLTHVEMVGPDQSETHIA